METQVRFLDEHPDCVLVGSRVTVVDPYGSPVLDSGQKLTHEEIDAELLSSGGGWAIVQPSVMMRADAVRRVGGYRGRHNVSEDQDLFLRLAEIGRVANLAEPLLLYRRHYQSVMHTQWRQREEVKEQIVREAYARRGRTMPADWKFDDWKPTPLDEQLRGMGMGGVEARERIGRQKARAARRPRGAVVGRGVAPGVLCVARAVRVDEGMVAAPNISVIMSVYNAGRYLRPAMESVLGQTVADVEYIVIDDGSTDGSPAVLREYADRDPRIRLTLRGNKGLTVSLNEALSQARGEFIARMDCDDVSLPDRFRKATRLPPRQPVNRLCRRTLRVDR